MGAMFRSEQMALCQMFIQPESAYLSVSELGETGTVQFRDVSWIRHNFLFLAIHWQALRTSDYCKLLVKVRKRGLVALRLHLIEPETLLDYVMFDLEFFF